MGPDWLHSDELGQSEWDCPVLFQDIQDLDNVLRFILMLLFYFNVYFTLSSSIILALTHTSIFRLLINTNALFFIFYRERKNYYWKIFS